MAVEVKDQGYRFTPFPRGGLGKKRLDNSVQADWEEVVVGKPVVRKTARWKIARRIVTEGWRYNPLHDMESIGWLLARSLFYQDHYLERVEDIPVAQFDFEWGDDVIDPFAAETAETRSERIKAYYTFGRALFVTRTERDRAMYRDLLDGQLKAHPLFPGVAPLGEIMALMREKLVEQYQKSEMDITTIDHTCAKEVTLEFIQQLHNAYEYLEDVASSGYEIKTRSLQSGLEMLYQKDNSSCLGRTKRPRDSDNDEKDDASHPSKYPRRGINNSLRRSSIAGPSLATDASATASLATCNATEPIKCRTAT